MNVYVPMRPILTTSILTAWWLLGEAALAGGPQIIYRDDFESGLRPNWQVLSGKPRIVAYPGTPNQKVLELGPSSKAMLKLDPPVRDLAVEVRVRFVEPRGWVEAPILLRSNDDGNRAIQVYLEQESSQVIAVRYEDGARQLGAAQTRAHLAIGPWYLFKVVAAGGRIGAWVDGELVLAFYDDEPRAGCVGVRVGDARTHYDNLLVRAPIEAERGQLRSIRLRGRPRPEMHTCLVSLPDGSQVVLAHPAVVEPLTPFEVVLRADKTATEATYVVIVAGKSYPIAPGEPLRVAFSGLEGERPIRLMRNGRPIATSRLSVQAGTYFEAGPFTDLFTLLRDRVAGDRATWYRHGCVIRTNPTWVRDHIHEMKAYKYWQEDLSSFVDMLIELQHAEGFFYEIIGKADHDHQAFVDAKHRLVEQDKDLCWIRLELEADVEYLMVEAAYAIWKASGDNSAMAKRLPHLKRALEYDFTDPTRWDATHGALKRTFTIDTWDFTYGCSDRNRRIEPNMPMGIMHGDNSGLYCACRQLAEMLRAAGESAKAAEWDKKGAELRKRVNSLCWNGRYYTHQILLQPVDTGVREEDILSLSNTYDINRGLPTHEMAVKIIDEYRARREKNAGKHFAEWYSIDPPYPKFGPYAAGHYINGGIAGFVAGELAKAALHHGREAYGADILHRVAKKVAEDGFIGFLYNAEGKAIGGGPQGWSAAAVISALIEGLAGICDDATCFHHVTISPRFAAAGIDQAKVCARYGPSGAYVTMAYDHDPAQRRITLRLAGVSEHARIRLLLPEHASKASVVEPKRIKSTIEQVEASRYLSFNWLGPLAQDVAEVTVQYEEQGSRGAFDPPA